jgi:CheY-like chemotaxis protein
MSVNLILVVEDDRLIARDIAMQLQELGYTPVGPTTTGEQAIEMAEKLNPQLVLMDVHLAGAMDGITAAEVIRGQLGIPSIFLSAFDAGDSMDRAKRAAPAGYLSKPFMEFELRDVIVAALKDN